MELIDQHTKNIMEGCKERARDAGLQFEKESLEYIVTNRDLIELTPKVMIPTLYDYWVHDVEVLKEKGRYELYPGNPYETVINTRPAISYYNDNNPDWLNVMIFYHVLAHIDFFQNNLFFRHTWEYDFTGQALSDKRMIARLRADKGRWVDYVIEFSRGMDNLVGYYYEMSRFHGPNANTRKNLLDYYFDVFLQDIKKVKITDYIKEVEAYNDCIRQYGDPGEQTFFSEIGKKYPELEALYKKSRTEKAKDRLDVMQFVLEYSDFLNKEENLWMKSVVQVIRNTSIFFQPQIRTKILNEGWASYWHEKLFLQDDRIKGHEVDFARVHSGVTSLSRVGLNPYAIGMRLFYMVEEMADKGKFSFDFERIKDADQRKHYDAQTGRGIQAIFDVRENFSDYMFIANFVNQDFVDRHKLFVVGKHLDTKRKVWQYYVKSRKAKAYRQMLLDTLYHPPYITVDQQRTKNGELYLKHKFEGKPLVKDYIANTMMGIEFLWGHPVKLETSEVVATGPARPAQTMIPGYSPAKEEAKPPPQIKWKRVVYKMEKRKLSKKTLS